MKIYLGGKIINVTNTTANAGSRATLIPDFIGQVVLQLDTNTIYISNGLLAGNFVVATTSAVNGTLTFTSSTISTTTPQFTGQLAVETDTGKTFTSQSTTIGDWTLSFPMPVSKTVFVDYVNGNDVTGAPESMIFPFKTKAAAIVSALTLSPNASNRVIIWVWNGLSTEGIVFTQSTIGIDFNLNGGSINVSSGSNAAIDDGNFACDSIIYNANTIQCTGGTGSSIHTRNISTFFTINAINITNSVATTVIFNQNGNLIVNGNIKGGALVQNIVSSQGVSTIINGNIVGTNTGNTTGLIVAAGICKLNGDVTSAGINAIGISAGTLTTNGRIVANSASRNSILKTGGILILESPIIVAGSGAFSVNSTTAQNIIIYGMGQQNLAENGNTTYKVGTMITDVLVQ